MMMRMIQRFVGSLELLALLIGLVLGVCSVIKELGDSGISENVNPPHEHTIYPTLLRRRRNAGAGFAAILSVTGEFMAELEHTTAEHGDPCMPSDNLSTDFCENAYYPQKGRMFCRTPDSGGNSTCECKFSKKENNNWEQMTYSSKHKLCLSPERGRCYELLMEKKEHGQNFYTKLDESDKQCDNTGLNKTSPGYLQCTKPHPRRFVSFDKRGFYCLRKADRSTDLDIQHVIPHSHNGGKED